MWFYQMDWYVGACSKTSCPQTDNNASDKYKVQLVESKNGEPWVQKKPERHDHFSSDPHAANQRWLVDNKQVQIVIGRDSNGDLIKAWEVRVEIRSMGARPVYSPVP